MMQGLSITTGVNYKDPNAANYKINNINLKEVKTLESPGKSPGTKFSNIRKELKMNQFSAYENSKTKMDRDIFHPSQEYINNTDTKNSPAKLV